MPSAGQSVMVRGEMFRREVGGLFTINLIDISLPERASGASASVGSPSPKKTRRVVKRNTVEAFEDETENGQSGSSQQVTGSSSTMSHTVDGGDIITPTTSAAKKSLKGKSVEK